MSRDRCDHRSLVIAVHGSSRPGPITKAGVAWRSEGRIFTVSGKNGTNSASDITLTNTNMVVIFAWNVVKVMQNQANTTNVCYT